jgi:hypothetical protein
MISQQHLRLNALRPTSDSFTIHKEMMYTEEPAGMSYMMLARCPDFKLEAPLALICLTMS